jgi:hypothetical protein
MKTFIFLLALTCHALAADWPLSPDHFQGKLTEWARARNEALINRPQVSDTAPVTDLSEEEKFVRFNVPLPVKLETAPAHGPSPIVVNRISESAKLYYEIFGKDSVKSFLWSGVETGNTLTSNLDYRWNSIREAGLYDPAIRAKFISGLKKVGVSNIRFGFSNHEIRKLENGEWDELSWVDATEMIEDFTHAGIRLSLDLHHFGIESRFCVDSNLKKVTYVKDGEELCDKLRYDPEKSFYLHPEWPDYFADFAGEVARRFFPSVRTFTLINEPETVKGFNSGLWFGAFPSWNRDRRSDAESFEVYRAINLGKAAVKGKLRIEKYVAEKKFAEKPIYFHVEAMVPKRNWDDFNTHIRYISSDTILGHEWLMDADLDQLMNMPLNEIGWHLNWDMIPREKRTVLHHLASAAIWWGFDGNPAGIEARKNKFLSELKELKRLHEKLLRETGQSMRSHTILGIDYYAHNEEGLEPKPELYNLQIQEGKRIGFFETARAYFERYQMPMMVTETGTPYFVYGARWHQQMLLEASKLATSGIPFVGYTIYPAIDTYGWEHAISRPKEPLYRTEGSLYNPSGIFYLTQEPPAYAEVFGWAPMEPKPFIFELTKQLRAFLP